ncbi:hypothetical protein PoB_000727600 [Plakobranchus ocellatus]|uniref:Uncharacterized protein n=1 Tax=Plakobranchus ocellatus TaxID=259542 RepID=A0AAV3YED2_9GAST|nr:hypothetical protein PoB_000727600 [Plakobranchus ocellatus]
MACSSKNFGQVYVAGCMVSSAVYAKGVSRTVTFDMTTLATSNAYSSRFLTPVLAVATALALIAAHRERNVRSDIENQVPRTYSTWRLRAVKGQDDGVGLNFVLTPTHLDAPSVSDATQLLHISSSEQHRRSRLRITPLELFRLL